MAVVFAGAGTFTSTTTGDGIAIDAPGNISEDDLLVCVVGAHESSLATPAGWTQLQKSGKLGDDQEIPSSEALSSLNTNYVR